MGSAVREDENDPFFTTVVTVDTTTHMASLRAQLEYVMASGERHKVHGCWLEDIQDLYAADKTIPEEILLPLTKSAIPDEIKKWKHKRLLEFRIAYRHHITGIKQVDPDFHSALVDEGFSCDGQAYREVIREIETHSAALTERINYLSKPSNS